jgi:hypothetical protein
MQTTLILTETPPAMRSRVMGIVTMCIGTGPVGVVMIGILSGQVGPPVAILIMAGLGLCGLSLVWRKLNEAQSGGQPARRTNGPHAEGVIDAGMSDMPASGQCLEVANSCSPPVGRRRDGRITGNSISSVIPSHGDRSNIDG